MSEDLPELRRRADADPQNQESILELARALAKTGRAAEAYGLLEDRDLGAPELTREIGARLFESQRPVIEDLLSGKHRTEISRELIQEDMIEPGEEVRLAHSKIPVFDRRPASMRRPNRWRWRSIQEVLEDARPVRGIDLSYGLSHAGFDRLSDIRTLSYLGLTRPVPIEALGSLRRLNRLEELGFVDFSLTEAWFEAMADWRSLSTLRLVLCSSEMPKRALPHIRRLELDRSTFQDAKTPHAPEALFAGRVLFPKLRQLSFGYDWLSSPFFEGLTEHKSLERFSSGQEIEAPWIRLLAKLPRLRALDLIVDSTPGVSSALSELRDLDHLLLVVREGASAKEMRAFLGFLSAMPGLSSLSLRHTRLKGAAIPDLAPLHKLRWLDLITKRFDRKSLGALEPLRELEQLSLMSWELGDVVLQSLPALPALRSLRLNSRRITRRCLKSLRRLPALRCLDLTGTNLSRKAARRKLPGVKVI